MPCAAILVGDGPVREVGSQEAASYGGPGFVWLHTDGVEEADLQALRGQEGIPDVIPAEACYLGWQQSLCNLARLVEPEIND